ncbi:MAG: hypothetical protein JWN25_3072 [Verrucomicrobiales bacterium]|nr:hypothetical protein [Verrucomicrobiales bacterium]MDB6129213.1 hypothetical protein [Verrucomicrobiales bacterium]
MAVPILANVKLIFRIICNITKKTCKLLYTSANVRCMFPDVETRHVPSVQREVEFAYRKMFPSADVLFVKEAFSIAVSCFSGKYKDYQPIDARYHDMEHTMQGSLCMARLLLNRHQSGAQPVLTEKMFQLGLYAILLHDTGYLKKKGDNEGTGAKYTLIHVNRSMEFAAELLSERNCSIQDILSVQNMIRCTGVNVDLRSIPFQSEIEQITGLALGTADLLGQMAASDYIEKLPILYAEFAESAKFNGGRSTAAGTFASAEDLMHKTPLFWEKYVQPKIKGDFGGLYQFLATPYPSGANGYIIPIEQNIQKLKARLVPMHAA